MNQLSIKILNFIASVEDTNEDEICKRFSSYSRQTLVDAIKPLCGTTAANGYILWHKSSSISGHPYDFLKILEKGKYLLVSSNSE
jgi:hypothetical protein